MTQIVGVWDDHDYGLNNAGIDFEYKDRNREFYLDFLGEAVDSERRTQTGTPLHIDYLITLSDSTGASVLIHFILLDNRYEFDSATDDRLGAN